MDESEPTEPRVSVQHCLLVRQGMTDESWRVHGDTVGGPYVLRGVSYRYRPDSQTDFPLAAKPPWAIFLRVTGWNAGPTRVLFRFHYRDGGRWRHLGQREMDQAIPFPDGEDGTRDVVLQLPYLSLGGAGLHAISVHFWYDGFQSDEDGRFQPDLGDEAPAWATDPEELFGTTDWAFGTVDYFYVET